MQRAKKSQGCPDQNEQNFLSYMIKFQSISRGYSS